ncbi:LOW QUALITY PROTEIN: hypothetical protein BC937DRAFT_87028 [Endogone sp. FLAS-F59071]|nr:LOW QUALITY PROTEIN: hypothetical protein BC937DRAFT_87028 [Endogone sp. FLAS-F59071]|eukprot:RUS19721.1 LOW QUALITY PROTEIN: hypothetical protein BC937DRAFT_87028 [Endogone sp. FLAS-F59071]
MDFSFDSTPTISNLSSAPTFTQDTDATDASLGTQASASSPALAHATAALAFLPTLLSTATAIIELLSSSSVSLSAASLSSEDPDYEAARRQRAKYDALRAELAEHVKWLDHNKLATTAEAGKSEGGGTTNLDELRETRDKLRKRVGFLYNFPSRHIVLSAMVPVVPQESAEKTRILKRVLDQSYALQFQVATLLSSTEDIGLGETDTSTGRSAGMA